MNHLFKLAAVGTIAATAIAFAGTHDAEARCGLACGVGLGVVGGIVAGAAIAAAQPGYIYHAPPPGVYYAPGYVYYTGPVQPGCHVYKWRDEWGRKHKDRICY